MTNPTNNGGLSSKTVEERKVELDRVLDNYEGSVGLPTFAFAYDETKPILEMGQDQLRRMTAVQCGEAAFLLNRFALHVQRAVNRERSAISWAEENITRITCDVTVNLSSYYSKEERRAYAIRNDDVAQKYDRVRVLAKTRCERLDFISQKVESVARSLMSLQHSKRGDRE